MEIISWKSKHEENSPQNNSPGKSPRSKFEKENVKKVMKNPISNSVKSSHCICSLENYPIKNFFSSREILPFENSKF